MANDEMLETLLGDALSNLDRVIRRAYKKIYGSDEQNVDDLDRQVIERARVIEFSESRRPPKMSEKIITEINDSDLAIKYSLLQVRRKFLATERKAAAGDFRGAFFMLLRTEMEIGVLNSYFRYGRIRAHQTRKGALAKLANDPKQRAKLLVRECWDAWQRKPTNYKGKSAFAKDMMTKFEDLESQAVITRWCGQWEKESAA